MVTGIDGFAQSADRSRRRALPPASRRVTLLAPSVPALRLLQPLGHRLPHRAGQPRQRAGGLRPRLRARSLQPAGHRRRHLRKALERRRRRRRSLTEPTSPTLADSKFLTRGGRGVPRRSNTYRSKLQELAPAGLSASDLPELTGRTRGESPTPMALNCSAACWTTRNLPRLLRH